MNYSRPIAVLVLLLAFLRVLNNCNINLLSEDYTCSAVEFSRSRVDQLTTTPQLERVRSWASEVFDSSFPSPHSDLLLGMVLGIDRLSKIPQFKESLSTTGTIHVVVASGFNMSLIIVFVGRIFSLYKKSGLLMILITTFLYTLLTGFEPPIVRAWIMGIISIYILSVGREVSSHILLIIIGAFILIVSPQYALSLSFQLSFLATLGILLFSSPIEDFFKKKNIFVPVLGGDLAATLSAQMFVTPLLVLVFGSLSIISPLVNFVVLWVVSPVTVLGFIYLAVYKIPLISSVLRLVIYSLADYFVVLVNYFGQFEYAEIYFSMSTYSMLLCYLLLFMSYRKYVKR